MASSTSRPRGRVPVAGSGGRRAKACPRTDDDARIEQGAAVFHDQARHLCPGVVRLDLMSADQTFRFQAGSPAFLGHDDTHFAHVRTGKRADQFHGVTSGVGKRPKRIAGRMTAARRAGCQPVCHNVDASRMIKSPGFPSVAFSSQTMQIADQLSQLNALSPLDGRYASGATMLRGLLSEAGFMAHRVEVEAAWLVALSDAGLPELPAFRGRAPAPASAGGSFLRGRRRPHQATSSASPTMTSRPSSTG